MQLDVVMVLGCLAGLLQASTNDKPTVLKTPPTLIRVVRQECKERNPEFGSPDGLVLRKQRSEGDFKFNISGPTRRSMSDQPRRRRANF